MDKKKRSFKKFVSDEGMKGIKKTATLYATENDDVTLDVLAEHFNLTSSAIKSIISYAIIHCIISYNLAILCMSKSHRNQAKYCKHDSKNKVTSSDIYYNKLIKRRLSFVKNFNEEKVKEVVTAYIDHPYRTAQNIAESLGFSITELNVILKKAIIFLIVDEEVANNLEKISLNKMIVNSLEWQHAKKIFALYKSSRIYYLTLNAKISQLHLQLEDYDNFVSSDEKSEYSKDALEFELETTKNKLKNFKDSFYLGNIK